MPRYIFNTTVGEYSAGTEVDILGGSDVEKVILVHPHCADFEDSFDVPIDVVTVRRNRTDMVSGPNRKERRADDPMVEARRETWIESNQ